MEPVEKTATTAIIRKTLNCIFCVVIVLMAVAGLTLVYCQRLVKIFSLFPTFKC